MVKKRDVFIFVFLQGVVLQYIKFSAKISVGAFQMVTGVFRFLTLCVIVY